MVNLSNKEIIIIVLGGFWSALCCVLSSNADVTMFLSSIYVIYALFLPIEQQFYLVALGLPNTKSLGFGGISASICICAIAALKYYCTEKKRPTLPAFAILFIIYSIQYAFRLNDFVEGFVMPLKTFLVALFFHCMSYSSIIAKNSFQIGIKASLALFVGILFALGASSISIGNELMRIRVVGNDPNILSTEIAFVLSYLCVYFYSYKQVSRTFFLVAVFILAVMSLYSGSRMGFILFALVLTISVFVNYKMFGRSMLLFLVSGTAIIVFLMSSMGQSLIDLIFTRMEALENRGDISNNRFETWEAYYEVFNSNPVLWFIGLGDYSKYGLNSMAHNALIEDIADYGLIGMFLLYSLFCGIYIKQYRHSNLYNQVNKRLFYMLPIMVPIIGGFTLHTYTNIINTTMLYIGVLCMTKQKNIIQKIKKA